MTTDSSSARGSGRCARPAGSPCASRRAGRRHGELPLAGRARGHEPLDRDGPADRPRPRPRRSPQLFAEEPATAASSGGEARRRIVYPGLQAVDEFLTSNMAGRLQVILSTIEPGGGTGEEAVHPRLGRGGRGRPEPASSTCGSRDEHYVLREGDAITFPSRLPALEPEPRRQRRRPCLFCVDAAELLRVAGARQRFTACDAAVTVCTDAPDHPTHVVADHRPGDTGVRGRRLGLRRSTRSLLAGIRHARRHSAPGEATRLATALRAVALAGADLGLLPLPAFADDQASPTPTPTPVAIETPSLPTPRRRRPRPRSRPRRRRRSPSRRARLDRRRPDGGSHARPRRLPRRRPPRPRRPVPRRPRRRRHRAVDSPSSSTVPIARDRPAVQRLLVRAGRDPDDDEPHPEPAEPVMGAADRALPPDPRAQPVHATRRAATTSPAGPGRCATGRTSRTRRRRSRRRPPRSTRSSRRSTGPIIRSASRSRAGPTPGSSSATRSVVELDDPTKRTILGVYVFGPLGPGSSDPWPYQYFNLATFSQGLHRVPRVAAPGRSGKAAT